MDRLELVSPAGSPDQLKAAVNAGADAVYLAYEKYGARASAENFDLDGLVNAVKFAHLRGVKVFLALNTLIKEKELNELIDFIFHLLKKASFNGIIIQDLAVKKIIKEIFPEIPVHASTQLNIHNTCSMEYLKKSGFKRVVLAREMTLEEISEISSKNILDIEIFGHGSQCYSYSGQCYLSSFVGERSGNRGRCPQPCRMKYSLVYNKDKGDQLKNQVHKFKGGGKTAEDYYFLSKSDLITIFHLPEIINAGVNALKLEGRIKTPEYVAIVTKIYIKYIDLYYSNPLDEYKVDENDIYKLKQIFAREINEGYLKEKFPEKIVSLKKSGSVGSSFGRILRIESEKSSEKNLINIYIWSSLKLNKKDILEIWTKKGNSRIEADIFELIDEKADKKLYRIQSNSNLSLNLNDRVFKYFDYELDREAKSIYLSAASLNSGDIFFEHPDSGPAKEDKSVYLRRENNVSDSENIRTGYETENYYKLKALLKKPDKVKNISDNSSGAKPKILTPNYNSVQGKSSVTMFIHDKNINSEIYLKNLKNIILANQEKHGEDFVNINLCYEGCASLFKKSDENEINKIINIFKNFENSSANFYLILPSIAYDKQISIMEKVILKLLNSGINSFYVSNLGVLQLLNKLSLCADFSINIILGYGLNLFNSFAISSIRENTDSKIIIKEIVLSAELTLQESCEIIADLNKNEEFQYASVKTCFSVFAYGFYPVMTSRVNYNDINQSTNIDINNYSLTDRKNYEFHISQDYLSNTQIFNSKKHCLLFDIKEIISNSINGFLIDSAFLEEEEIYNVFKLFIEGLLIAKVPDKLGYDGLKPKKFSVQKYEAFLLKLAKSPYLTDYTKGHFNREVM